MRKLIILISAILFSFTLLPAEIPLVRAQLETDPIPMGTDSSDDVAIWSNSSKTLILGVSKNKEKEGGRGGIGLYNLQGKEISFFEAFDGENIGPINNIDLRQGFSALGKKLDILAGSNRSIDKDKEFKGISLFEINGEKESLNYLGTFPIKNAKNKILEPYGLCMYHSQKSDRFYVLSVLKNGELYQDEILEENSQITLIQRRVFDFSNIIERAVDAKLVDFVIKDVLADYRLGEIDKPDLSDEIMEELGQRYQLEGCVADDKNGILYVGMEKLGIFKIDLESEEIIPRLMVETVQSKNETYPDIFPLNAPRITDDVEGISLFNGKNGEEYLIVSIQGISEYALFDRKYETYLGSFKLTLNDKDPITQTDGLDILAMPSGELFPDGIMVVHDHQNTNENGEVQNANYKIVGLREIFEALNF
jgi:3-phytase